MCKIFHFLNFHSFLFNVVEKISMAFNKLGKFSILRLFSGSHTQFCALTIPVYFIKKIAPLRCNHSWKVKAVSICCSAIICSLTCTFAVRGECGSLRRFASHGRAISGMDSSRAADLSECNRKKESNFVSPQLQRAAVCGLKARAASYTNNGARLGWSSKGGKEEIPSCFLIIL